MTHSSLMPLISLTYSKICGRPILLHTFVVEEAMLFPMLRLYFATFISLMGQLPVILQNKFKWDPFRLLLSQPVPCAPSVPCVFLHHRTISYCLPGGPALANLLEDTNCTSDHIVPFQNQNLIEDP